MFPQVINQLEVELVFGLYYGFKELGFELYYGFNKLSYFTIIVIIIIIIIITCIYYARGDCRLITCPQVN